jgi:mannose-6-phosphate isomerase
MTPIEVPFVARRVPKPWGYELIWAQTDRYIGKTMHIERGHQLSYQYHEHKDETICVLRGLLDLLVETPGGDRSVFRLAPGQSYRIAPHVRHRLTAIETCDVLEASSPEANDIVRLEDRYGRVAP